MLIAFPPAGRPAKVRSGNWSKLELVLSTLDENYMDEFDHEDLSVAAIESLLSELDPHTVYMPPVDLKDSQEDLAGNFSGIGIQFNVPNDTAIVIEVIPGGPALKTGLLAGDRILSVDGRNIAGVKFPQDSMVRMMKGPAGTKVELNVKRGSENIAFNITRGTVPTHSVDAAFMVNDTVGFLRLGKFSRTTAKEFVTAGLELKKQGMKHLVVDLRDNSGGYLDQSLLICNQFLPKDSLIVYTEGLHKGRENYYADGKGKLLDMGLALLVSEGSASSSEIFAGAMQDNGRALLVGRRTFGKGLVQEPFFFSDGSGLRVSVARFYTPSGRCIQKSYEGEDYQYDLLKRFTSGEMVDADSMSVEKGGIIPDVFVPMDTTKVASFFIDCRNKATAVRFASAFFDVHKDELQAIDDYDMLLSYLGKAKLEKAFLEFARTKDGISPTKEEWRLEKNYLMTQVRALIGRYSKLGDNAFYHLYLNNDPVFKAAMRSIAQ
ncbi:MAG: S41 family peptidase [Bacteroidales bacterium]|nr:S41 family peptidase [Bacteroidales bacterium]